MPQELNISMWINSQKRNNKISVVGPTISETEVIYYIFFVFVLTKNTIDIISNN